MFKIVLVLSAAVFAIANALPADVSKSVQATSININGKEATQVIVDGKKVHESVDSRFGEEGGSLDSRSGKKLFTCNSLFHHEILSYAYLIRIFPIIWWRFWGIFRNSRRLVTNI